MEGPVCADAGLLLWGGGFGVGFVGEVEGHGCLGVGGWGFGGWWWGGWFSGVVPDAHVVHAEDLGCMQ